MTLQSSHFSVTSARRIDMTFAWQQCRHYVMRCHALADYGLR